MSNRTDLTINLVSNRLPVSVAKRRGKIEFRPSAGGLATGLASLPGATRQRWIGWPGIARENTTEDQRAQIEEELNGTDKVPVFLSRDDVKRYYLGFCNETLWPLFHYFSSYAQFDEESWEAYRRVNLSFRDVVLEYCSPDEPVWIHDYHLMLLPRMLREAWPNARIGFFLHIPFPSFEVFRMLPWRDNILDGLLGADLIGLHTSDYVRYFMNCVDRLRNAPRNERTVNLERRRVTVDAFPLGIDYARFSETAARPGVEKQVAAIRKKVGDRRVVISIDRLDYTKGIVQRLEAFELFLSQNPEYRDRVTLILLAVPSRTAVGDYADLRETVERLVSRINGAHGSIGWVPVWYLFRGVPFERLLAMYRTGDVAMVTPIRDGMNLIAKEYVASRTEGDGVLVISEMAGAVNEMDEAIVVNPNDRQAVADALKAALEMPASAQRDRIRSIQHRLRGYDVGRWAGDFLSALDETPGSGKAASGD